MHVIMQKSNFAFLQYFGRLNKRMDKVLLIRQYYKYNALNIGILFFADE